ncbi:hypothetical protein D9M72_488900 [compost metagenome]
MSDGDGIDRQHEGHAARQKHAGKRDDKGGHLEIMDDGAHHRAEERRDEKSHRKGDDRMDGGSLQHHGQEHTGEGDDGADRQVDAAGQDHEGHADGGDAEEGVVGQKVADHPRRQDVGVLHHAERIAQHEDDDGCGQRQVFGFHRACRSVGFLPARRSATKVKALRTGGD